MLLRPSECQAAEKTRLTLFTIFPGPQRRAQSISERAAALFPNGLPLFPLASQPLNTFCICCFCCSHRCLFESGLQKRCCKPPGRFVAGRFHVCLRRNVFFFFPQSDLLTIMFSIELQNHLASLVKLWMQLTSKKNCAESSLLSQIHVPPLASQEFSICQASMAATWVGEASCLPKTLHLFALMFNSFCLKLSTSTSVSLGRGDP